MEKAVLLLMHQGKSFTREAAAAAGRQGLAMVALSSQPETAEALAESRRLVADCLVTDEPALQEKDLDDVIARFAGRGFEVVAAIATFEGYRLLMAALNAKLGAADSSVEALRLCLDKLELRQFLFAHGLSAVRSHRVLPGAVPPLDPAARWFVKPVRGASSFAAFILQDPRDLDDLPQIQQQMRDDHRMHAIFMDRYDFLAEEYVEGPEFSFETIVAGEAVHLCVQEKARVERRARTTLEAMSVSPPVSVGQEVLSRGAAHVSSCLAELRTLGLTAGAFHIEAKYWSTRDRWEIIEINPRMGGSLINASVEVITGESVLDLWTWSLLAQGEARAALQAHLRQASQLEALRTGTASKGTIFLSKYGEKGRTVDSISFDPRTRTPDVLKLHVSPGTKLDDSDRAICLMDAMWEVPAADLPDQIEVLDRQATEDFHVRYR